MSHDNTQSVHTNPQPGPIPLDQALALAGKQIDAGHLQAAEGMLRQILQQQPRNAFALHLLGVLAHKAGKSLIAIDLIGKAIEIQPDVAQFHSNRGEMCRMLKRLDQAIHHGEQAVRLSPSKAQAHSNLGIAYYDNRNYARAAACQRKALELSPALIQALNNLGSIHSELKDTESALACYRRVLEIEPDNVDALNNLGQVLKDIGRFDEAIVSYRRAIEIKPDYTDCHSNMLLALNCIADHAPAHYLALAQAFGRIVAARAEARFSAWTCHANPRRLRVGLVSGDLRKHSVGHFLEGLITHIDPARIELIAYSTHHAEDELSARIRPSFAAWKSLVVKDDEAAARLIHADGVHVLLDLSGHTAHNRLPVFAWKPAPVQATWLGLPATTGVAEMDYVIGDPHALPPEFESHFTETVWRMPDSCLCLTVPDAAVEVAPLPALAAGYVTFGSFNNLSKMSDAVVAAWARILERVPNSRLYLKTGQLNDANVCAHTRQRFAAHGIDPDRLLLGGMLASRDDHFAAYNKMDIALDTFPYPGVTTSVEALWMGVPVLSMRGDRFLSSTAGSIAHNAGLPDWIAADEDDYVARAVEQATNSQHLAILRSGLRQQVLASPLFDAPRFARNFEDTLGHCGKVTHHAGWADEGSPTFPRSNFSWSSFATLACLCLLDLELQTW